MADLPVRVGETVAEKYRVEELVGAGGTGVVFAARHIELDQRVALKFLLPSVATSAVATERFRREARLAAVLRSEHACRVLDVGTHDTGLPFIVMEYLVGSDLAKVLESRGHLPVAEAVRYVIEAGEAVSEANRNGIVHRDLKPANLFLATKSDTSQTVKVLDFGVSKSLLEAQRLSALTQSASFVGSPLYMSPEQLESSRDVDARTDVWSLGVTLCELLTGTPPFVGETIPQLIAAVLHSRPQLSRQLPTALVSVVSRALEKDRGDRYASVAELAADLAPFATFGKSTGRPKVRRTGDSTLQGLSSNSEVLNSELGVSDAIPSVGLAADAWQRVTHAIQAAARGALRATLPSPAERPATSTEARSGDSILSGCLPHEMLEHEGVLTAFLLARFREVEVSEYGIAKLQGVRVADSERYQYYAVFVGHRSPDHGVLGAHTFMERVEPLEQYLKTLDKRPSVVIAVTSAAALGSGVASKILTYLQEHNARVVPMYVGEIVEAQRLKRLEALFDERLAEFEPPNMFALETRTAVTNLVRPQDVIPRFLIAVEHPGALIAVYGLPGSGKSALIRMAFEPYEGQKLRPMTVHCSALSEQSTESVWRALARLTVTPEQYEPVCANKEVLERLARGAPAVGAKSQPVLVIEDADWIVEALSVEEDSKRRAAQEFWSSIASAARDTGLRVVVTGVRAFALGHRRIDGWQNPLPSCGLHAWRVPSLGKREHARLISDLGMQTNVIFDKRALASVFALSGGHAGVSLQICSKVVDASKMMRDHALACRKIRARDIKAAALSLATWPTFGNSTLAPFSELERSVLQVLATTKVRTVNDLRRTLEDADVSRPGPTLSKPRAVSTAFRHLQDVGVVELQKGRYVISVPLFASWIATNVDRSKNEPERLRRGRWAWISIGATLSGLAFATHLTLSGPSTMVSEPVKWQGCEYRLSHPNRLGLNEPFDLQLNRSSCSADAKLEPQLWLRAAPGTVPLQDGKYAGVVSMSLQCPTRSCTALAHLTVAQAPANDISFVLIERDSDIMQVHIALDELQDLSARGKKTMQWALLLPLILGAIATYHRQVFRGLLTVMQAVRWPGRDQRSAENTHRISEPEKR